MTRCDRRCNSAAMPLPAQQQRRRHRALQHLDRRCRQLPSRWRLQLPALQLLQMKAALRLQRATRLQALHLHLYLQLHRHLHLHQQLRQLRSYFPKSPAQQCSAMVHGTAQGGCVEVAAMGQSLLPKRQRRCLNPMPIAPQLALEQAQRR